MDCDRAAKLLPDYWQGALEARDAEFFIGHLKMCASCRETAALGESLAQLPQEQPSPALREHFQAMLDAYQQGRQEASHFAARESGPSPWGSSWMWRRPTVAMGAVALLLVVLGFMAGRSLNSADANHSQQELAAMQMELTNMRQLVVLSMLQQDSASQRLQGVTWSTRQPKADPMILGALLHTLRYDSSVDVRLAALDALSRYPDQTQVRQGLTEALESRQSPLVQFELIDLLVTWRDGSALDQLRKIEQDKSVDPAVRERARRAIDQLS
ncbi:MAG TPA: zf-HC2 domain-containing protein [Candidatus Acidoferrales bacterium]|nr:zf-HC2 domain-containing protein [Candidatus Acidoferrales bacterium]